jgi:hypothetical protein
MNNLDENARKKFLFLDKNNQYFPQIIDKEHHVIKKVLVIPKKLIKKNKINKGNAKRIPSPKNLIFDLENQ